MNSRKYFLLLFLTIVISFVVHFIIGIFLPLTNYLDILSVSIIFFTILSLVVYWLSQRAVNSNQQNFFLYIIMINVFVKLISAFVLILIYTRVKNPTDKYFLVPFLMTYLVFTLFETVFLSAQAKVSK